MKKKPGLITKSSTSVLPITICGKERGETKKEHHSREDCYKGFIRKEPSKLVFFFNPKVPYVSADNRTEGMRAKAYNQASLAADTCLEDRRDVGFYKKLYTGEKARE